MPTTTAITADSFPTPALAVRSSDPARRAKVAAFAEVQAQAAEQLRVLLDQDLRDMAHPLVRIERLRVAYAQAHAWRYSLALGGPDARGSGTVLEARRVLLSLERGGDNMDRLGYVGRHREGAQWDPERQQYVGGTPTPAHDVLAHYGRLALARFDREGVTGDVLRTVVRAPSGAEIRGNKLIRGRTAARITQVLADRLAARGHDVSRMETGGDPIYAVTGSTTSRGLCWTTGMAVLGAAEPGDAAAWRTAAYLLYQGIGYKRGTDAILRVFLVAAGAVLLGEAPVLPHDLDLRCMVLGQEQATEMDGDTALLRG
ncbi:hypothetical protein [Saccharothrix xinjiangensis]|uniref:Uncharacterized protein n=1 Tax=Saccharothrix xinjiangensis TaxID=204798 RepID=A0ABV9XZ20_9PSEU